MKEIDIPEGCIFSIQTQAFLGCINLESIVIPSTVESLDWHVFAFCKKLKHIEIKSQLESTYHVFSCCDALEEIKFHRRVKQILWSNFRDCINLKKIYVPKKQVETYKKRLPKEAQHLIEGF